MYHWPKFCFWARWRLFQRYPAFVVISFTTSEVTGGFLALVLLLCCKWRQCNDFLAFLVFIMLGVVELFILALFFSREALSRSSGMIISSSCRELISPLRRKLFLLSFLQGILARSTSGRATLLRWTEMTLNI